MKTIKADQISNLPQGSQVWIEGRRFIRGCDVSNRTDLLIDPQTGWIGEWSRLILGNEDVETTPMENT